MHTQPTVRATPQRHPVRVWPHDGLGWWAFGLLLAAAASPAYVWGLWVVVRFDDPEATLRTIATAVVAIPAIVLGAAALTRRRSASIAVVVLATIVVLEVAWSLVWVVSFGNAAFGVAIALGTAVCAALGAFIGQRAARP